MIKGNEDKLTALLRAELFQVGKLEIEKPQRKILDVFVSLARVPFIEVQAKQWLAELSLCQSIAAPKIATTDAAATATIGKDDHLVAP